MTKSELILKLSESNPHLYQRDIEILVATIFEEISYALECGNRVELRGFGTFATKNAVQEQVAILAQETQYLYPKSLFLSLKLENN